MGFERGASTHLLELALCTVGHCACPVRALRRLDNLISGFLRQVGREGGMKHQLLWEEEADLP